MYADGWNSSGLVTLEHSSPNLYHNAYYNCRLLKIKLRKRRNDKSLKSEKDGKGDQKEKRESEEIKEKMEKR